MNNLPNNRIDEQEIQEQEKAIFDLGKNIVTGVKPDRVLLARILEKLETENVTNPQLVRNSNKEWGEVVSPLNRLTFHMGNIYKSMVGVAVVAVLLLVVVSSTSNQGQRAAMAPAVSKAADAPIVLNGEVIETDSLLADLMSIESSVEEPIIDDSAILLALTETNNYEIQ